MAEDIIHVERLRFLLPQTQIFANLRCGRWYVRETNPADSLFAHFKSADGHCHQWKIEPSRPNLHFAVAAARASAQRYRESLDRGSSTTPLVLPSADILATVSTVPRLSFIPTHAYTLSRAASEASVRAARRLTALAGGVVLVDATRKGKRFPDSLSRTVPIWACIINRTVLSFLLESQLSLEAFANGAQQAVGANTASPTCGNKACAGDISTASRAPLFPTSTVAESFKAWILHLASTNSPNSSCSSNNNNNDGDDDDDENSTSVTETSSAAVPVPRSTEEWMQLTAAVLRWTIALRFPPSVSALECSLVTDNLPSFETAFKKGVGPRLRTLAAEFFSLVREVPSACGSTSTTLSTSLSPSSSSPEEKEREQSPSPHPDSRTQTGEQSEWQWQWSVKAGPLTPVWLHRDTLDKDLVHAESVLDEYWSGTTPSTSASTSTTTTSNSTTTTPSASQSLALASPPPPHPPSLLLLYSCSRTEPTGEAPRESWTYIQGAADDEEFWTGGVTAPLFHKYLARFAETRDDEECDEAILAAMEEEQELEASRQQQAQRDDVKASNASAGTDSTQTATLSATSSTSSSQATGGTSTATSTPSTTNATSATGPTGGVVGPSAALYSLHIHNYDLAGIGVGSLRLVIVPFNASCLRLVAKQVAEAQRSSSSSSSDGPAAALLLVGEGLPTLWEPSTSTPTSTLSLSSSSSSSSMESGDSDDHPPILSRFLPAHQQVLSPLLSSVGAMDEKDASSHPALSVNIDVLSLNMPTYGCPQYALFNTISSALTLALASLQRHIAPSASTSSTSSATTSSSSSITSLFLCCPDPGVASALSASVLMALAYPTDPDASLDVLRSYAVDRLAVTKMIEKIRNKGSPLQHLRPILDRTRYLPPLDPNAPPSRRRRGGGVGSGTGQASASSASKGFTATSHDSSNVQEGTVGEKDSSESTGARAARGENSSTVVSVSEFHVDTLVGVHRTKLNVVVRKRIDVERHLLDAKAIMAAGDVIQDANATTSFSPHAHTPLAKGPDAPDAPVAARASTIASLVSSSHTDADSSFYQSLHPSKAFLKQINMYFCQPNLWDSEEKQPRVS